MRQTATANAAAHAATGHAATGHTDHDTGPWPQARLAEVVRFNPRQSRAALAPDMPVAYVAARALDAASATAAAVVCRLDAMPSGAIQFKDGDVVAASRLAALRDARVAQPRIGQPLGICGPGLYALRADPDFLDARFLLHFLRQPRLRAQVAAQARAEGASGPALGFLKDCLITLPPLARQRRLDDLLAMCAQHRRTLDRFGHARQERFDALFGDAQQISKNWPRTTVGEQTDAVVCGSSGWHGYRAAKGDAIIKPARLGHGRMLDGPPAHVRIDPGEALALRTRVSPGDVLLAFAPGQARAAVAPGGIGTMYVDQGVAILRTRAVDPAFLAAYLCSPACVAALAAALAARAGLPARAPGADVIAGLPMPLPPAQLQREFAAQMEADSHQEDAALARMAGLAERFARAERAAFGRSACGRATPPGDGGDGDGDGGDPARQPPDAVFNGISRRL